ncbi:PAS domain S-box-containing protein/diguanylate cyclase (GGDEF) domain-containing protein [Marinobacter sp. es.048]|uniref:sensor domain-containing diguanylate cyclase n=1 Tax=Marinobacter sp. es.048 TaxID=1761795 RepID=UPI000B58A6D6|nr:sensor domain-containing diguanylate cyclase [Marinobacter sp. es.048]SNC61636.1 PAS domain S-box-containing protein/diguanylate cyclase (GGDEF) domain-containing protein [Marinobacter sp. es.048]
MELTPEIRLKAILEGTGAGTWEWNLDTGEVIYNPRWADLLGYQLEELQPVTFKTWENLCHPKDLQKAREALARYLDGDSPQFDCVVRMLHKYGDWRYIHTRGTLLTDEQGLDTRWLMGTHLDVTREKLSQHQMEQLAKSLPGIIYIFVLEPDGRYFFSYLSDKTWDFYGLTAEECLADPDKIFNLIHPDDLPRVHDSIAISAETLEEWVCEYRVQTKRGSYWLKGVSRPERDPDGRISWHGMTINIDTQKNLELELEQLSITDELTGSYNRRYMLRKLEESVAQGERYGDTFSLISLDIDFFKTINDSYGHPTGDAVLQRFADIIESRTRKSDIVARTGGEEFIIFMPNTGLSEASQVAESLRIVLQAESFVSAEGETFGITFSAGVVNWSGSGSESQTTSVRALLSACDQSMYAAKRAGRNRIVADSNGE